MNMTFLEAKELARQGKWQSAWAIAQLDDGLLDVSQDRWEEGVRKILTQQASQLKTSIFFEKLIYSIKDFFIKEKMPWAEALFDHMVVVADNDTDFKQLFDSCMIDFSAEKLKQVTSVFGDFWDDKTLFCKNVDAINQAFMQIE